MTYNPSMLRPVPNYEGPGHPHLWFTKPARPGPPACRTSAPRFDRKMIRARALLLSRHFDSLFGSQLLPDIESSDYSEEENCKGITGGLIPRGRTLAGTPGCRWT